MNPDSRRKGHDTYSVHGKVPDMGGTGRGQLQGVLYTQKHTHCYGAVSLTVASFWNVIIFHSGGPDFKSWA
jgi:hypothetical protein